MAIPDITTLTEEELHALQAATADRLHVLEHADETNRAALLDPVKVDAAIAALTAQVASMIAITDATNATINAGPAPFIKDLARASKRNLNNTIRLLRIVGGRLESSSVGDEA